MDPIAQYAQDRPDTKALVHGERSVSWSELDRRVNRAARALQGLGVGAGDVVAVAFRNSVEFFELIGAAGRVGATVMPVSFRNIRDEVEYLVGDAKALAVFGEPENADVFAGLPQTIFRGEHYEGLLADQDEQRRSTAGRRGAWRRCGSTHRARPGVPRRSSARAAPGTPRSSPRRWPRSWRPAWDR